MGGLVFLLSEQYCTYELNTTSKQDNIETVMTV